MNLLKYIAVGLALVTLAAAAPERVLIITDEKGKVELTRLLNQGWTVKHQSAAMGLINSAMEPVRYILVFTLISPPDKVLAAQAAADLAEKNAAFEKRRAEYMKAKNPPVEKGR